MKYKNSQSGFSLVETLVSITILLIVIIGPMTISSSAAKSTSFSSEQVTAFFLAQEGLELVQKGRDDLFNRHFLSGNTPQYLPDPWGDFTSSGNSGLYHDCYESDGCGLETSGNAAGSLVTPKDCTSDTNQCLLFFNPASGNIRSRYTHTTGVSTVPTPFTRVIKITYDVAHPYEVRVISEVTWRSGNLKQKQTVSVESYLLNTYAY